MLPDGFDLLLNHTGYLLPEVLLLITAVGILTAGLFRAMPARWLVAAAAAGFSGSALMSVWLWPSNPVDLFYSTLRADQLSAVLRLLVLLAGLLLLAFPIPNQKKTSEYLFFLLIVALGASLLVMSTDLLLVVLALEVVSIASFALVGLTASAASAEGAWKFFLVGSVATAVTLFGMSYLFGATGSTQFTAPGFIGAALGGPSLLLQTGALFALAGMLFKMGAVPFHWWAPDAYQAAPLPVVAMLSTVPKVAGIGVFIRFTLALHAHGNSGLPWQDAVAAIALVTILIGSLGGLLQTDARRLMAYSSIAQTGFVLAGLAAMSAPGIQAALFYLWVLALSNLLVFAALQSLAQQANGFHLPAWAGLGRFHPQAAVGLVVGLVSLAGLPPAGGFMAKLFVFSALWQSCQNTAGPLALLLFVLGLGATVLGLFFYLKAPYYLLIKKGDPSGDGRTAAIRLLFMWMLAATTLLLFFAPGLLMGWLNRVTFVP
jgi:NADH-quinone oxidoreductase subunit N